MRNFKFRAFYRDDISLGTPLLFEQKLVDDELFFVCKEDNVIRYPFSNLFTDDDWIIQQFTGIIDKNGVDIYEGDIVKIFNSDLSLYDLFPFKVYFSEKYAEFSLSGGNSMSWHVCPYHIFEVIGDIIRTPDVMKDKIII